MVAADNESCLSARTSNHDSGAIQLVSALRSQPTDIRTQHFLGQAGRLQTGNAADLSLAWQNEFCRVAAGDNAVRLTPAVIRISQEWRQTDESKFLRESSSYAARCFLSDYVAACLYRPTDYSVAKQFQPRSRR